MGEGRPHTIYKVCSVYKKTIVNALLIHYERPCVTKKTSDHLLAEFHQLLPAFKSSPGSPGLIVI